MANYYRIRTFEITQIDNSGSIVVSFPFLDYFCVNLF
jgi:hypothetical protein